MEGQIAPLHAKEKLDNTDQQKPIHSRATTRSTLQSKLDSIVSKLRFYASRFIRDTQVRMPSTVGARGWLVVCRDEIFPFLFWFLHSAFLFVVLFLFYMMYVLVLHIRSANYFPKQLREAIAKRTTKQDIENVAVPNIDCVAASHSRSDAVMDLFMPFQTACEEAIQISLRNCEELAMRTFHSPDTKHKEPE